MALSESDFTNPHFIRYREGATLVRNNRARFDCVNYSQGGNISRAWRNKPMPGYNAQNPALHPDRINLNTDSLYIRAR